METIPRDLLQAHIERISDYLLCGEGIWWHHNPKYNDIIFHDGKDEPDEHIEGPRMTDFTEYSLRSILEHVESCWKKCVDSESVKLPIKIIHIYDSEGYLSTRKHYAFDIIEEDEDEEQFTDFQLNSIDN